MSAMSMNLGHNCIGKSRLWSICSHIGAVVVENVRIYHDLGYILVICEYLQHKILECLRRRAKPTDAFAAAYYFLQVSTTYL